MNAIRFTDVMPRVMGEKLDAYFAENGWQLQAWDTNGSVGYQVYFGKGVQVDNHFEYGFPYLYDIDELQGFAEGLYERLRARDRQEATHAPKKYMNVDVVGFLQKIVDANTETYQEDFKLDKKIFAEVADGRRLEGNVWLWMSRQHGTQCMSEREVFIKDSPAYSTWTYYANDFVGESIKAYAVDVLGAKDGVIRGNVFELDYKAHAAEVVKNASEALEVLKVFEDGFEDRVSPERSGYAYYKGLVEEHGAIVASRWAAKDEGALQCVLNDQKRARDKLRVGWAPRVSLDEQMAGARAERVGDNAPGAPVRETGPER